MSDRERGEQIRKRLDTLPMSDRAFCVVSGVNRKTLQRVIDGVENVRPSSVRQIETWLSQLEAEGEPADEPRIDINITVSIREADLLRLLGRTDSAT